LIASDWADITHVIGQFHGGSLGGSSQTNEVANYSKNYRRQMILPKKATGGRRGLFRQSLDD